MSREPRLTHEEACRLVDGAIERCAKTLAYIRLKIEHVDPRTEFSRDREPIRSVDRANLLCNINWYGAYLEGARAMARAMEDWRLMDFPSEKIGSGNYKGTVKRENPIVNKAIFDLFLKSIRNLEYCLQGLPLGVEIQYDVERDKKGKIKSAKARFVKKETTYEEI